MEYRILGAVEVWTDGQQVRLRKGRQRALLALLLIHRGAPLSIARLLDQLWNEQPPPTATAALYTYINALRRALEPDRPKGAPGQVLVRLDAGYALRFDAEQLDSAQFERLARAGRNARHTDPARAIALLRAADDLWRGPALADLDGFGFAQAERRRLEDLRLLAVEARILGELSLGRHAEVTGELDRLVHEHQWREDLHTLRMLALYLADRQADALAAYHHARKVLASDLGVDPGKRLSGLFEAILRHEPPSELLSHLAGPGPTGSHAPSSRPEQARDTPLAPEELFVGRDAERVELRAALDAARESHGRVVLVAGEPGIGKTRIAREFSDEARTLGVAVLWGRAWEDDGAPAYWPWIQVLRSLREAADPADLGRHAEELTQLLSELADGTAGPTAVAAVDAPEARFRLFDRLTRLLVRAAADQTMLIVLDDIHRADAASLLLLDFLTNQLADAHLLLVATYRNVDAQPNPALRRVLAQLAREPITRLLHLDGLGQQEVSELIQLATGRRAADWLAATVHQHTGGNPLFVGEVVRLLRAVGQPADTAGDWAVPVPASVAEIVGQRVNALSDQAQAVLATAAVIGPEFDLDILTAARELAAEPLLDAIDEACRAGLIARPPGKLGRYRFGHMLVRDALYEQLATAQRARLHRTVAHAIETARSGDLTFHLAEVAHHYRNAPVDQQPAALDYTIRAARQAMAVLAYEEAARLLIMALDQPLNAQQRGELLLGLGDAQMKAGDTTSAQDAFIQAADVARVHGMPELLARCALGLAEMTQFNFGRPESSQPLVGLLQEALTVLDKQARLRVRVLAALAIALYWPGAGTDWQNAEGLRAALSAEAVQLAREHRDPAELALALHAYCFACFGPDNLDERLALGPEILRQGQAANNRELMLEGHRWRAVSCAETGDLSAMRETITAYNALAAQLRQPLRHYWAHVWRATDALLRGEFAAAEEHNAAALRVGQQLEGLDTTQLQTASRRSCSCCAASKAG